MSEGFSSIIHRARKPCVCPKPFHIPIKAKLGKFLQKSQNILLCSDEFPNMAVIVYGGEIFFRKRLICYGDTENVGKI